MGTAILMLPRVRMCRHACLLTCACMHCHAPMHAQKSCRRMFFRCASAQADKTIQSKTCLFSCVRSLLTQRGSGAGCLITPVRRLHLS